MINSSPLPRGAGIVLLVIFIFSVFLPTGALSEENGGRYDFEDPFEEETAPDGREKPADPLESWNRVVFQVNDFFYLKILDPTARGYQFVTPRPLRRGVRNFFSNLNEPLYFVNSLLQGEGSDAHTAFARFTVNSTFGLGGLFDVVGEEPEQAPRRFDQTLATWGTGQGFYIVWPFLGPATLRSTVGRAGDTTLDPTWHVSPSLGVEATALYTLNEAPIWLREYERMKEHMIDPYSGVKNAYIEQTKYR